VKRNLKSSSRSGREPVRTESIHFRLCHVCLYLNEAAQDIAECEACNCSFVSDSVWDTSSKEAQYDAEDEDMTEAFKAKDKGLNGLTVVW
jgi:hypothetical protein